MSHHLTPFTLSRRLALATLPLVLVTAACGSSTTSTKAASASSSTASATTAAATTAAPTTAAPTTSTAAKAPAFDVAKYFAASELPDDGVGPDYTVSDFSNIPAGEDLSFGQAIQGNIPACANAPIAMPFFVAKIDKPALGVQIQQFKPKGKNFLDTIALIHIPFENEAAAAKLVKDMNAFPTMGQCIAEWVGANMTRNRATLSPDLAGKDAKINPDKVTPAAPLTGFNQEQFGASWQWVLTVDGKETTRAESTNHVVRFGNVVWMYGGVTSGPIAALAAKTRDIQG